jgi:tRNA (adenine37-N6)-methyltransferase
MNNSHRIDLPSCVIGIVHSPYLKHEGTPIQPNYHSTTPAQIAIHSEFRAGLKDLEGFERIWILVWLDRSKQFSLLVVPYRDTTERGIFATRAPSRPSPIGLSCVKIQRVRQEEGIIDIESVDLLDGTPILDIKPYVAEFDAFTDAKQGWYTQSQNRTVADNRFIDEKSK